jgi:hypothetical protein
MSTEWFYTQGGQQQGPVSAEQLQFLIGSGRVNTNDLVWNQSMTDWVPASQAPGLSAAPPAAGADPHPPGVIGYAAPTSEGVFATPRAMEMLRKTRPWARFLSVVIFIGAGLMLLVAMFFLFAGSRMRGGAPGGMAFAYVIMALLYIMPGIYLGRYATHLATLQRMNRSTDLENALEAQKSLWRYVGIIVAVIVCLYALILLIAVPFAMLGR